MKKLLPLLVLLLAGCSDKYTYTDHKEEVARVFMHEPGRYSVLNKDLKTVDFRDMASENNDCELVTDVPKDKPMWYEAKKRHPKGARTSWRDNWIWVRIHIHNAQDVNGAGWKTNEKHPNDVGTVPIE